MVQDVMDALVVEMPYLIPGLGVYQVDLRPDGKPRERIAALRFVAQIQQDDAADAFATELRELADCHFETEDEEAPVGLRLVDPS